MAGLPGVVLARFGSEIGSNLDRTELNARFRFSVRAVAEPNAAFRFGVRTVERAFELEPNLEPHHRRFRGHFLEFWVLFSGNWPKLARVRTRSNAEPNLNSPGPEPNAAFAFGVQAKDARTRTEPNVASTSPARRNRRRGDEHNRFLASFTPPPWPGPKPSPGQAKARDGGLAWDVLKPKPGKAGPKPWLSGQAKARPSLIGAERVNLRLALRTQGDQTKL
ncbi:hypothetical protein C8R46DRAFT_1040616 [Mycena filopes]|nr:hypothetical protein C8R46DRAFT_1040616 [Mycena filopes]